MRPIKSTKVSTGCRTVLLRWKIYFQMFSKVDFENLRPNSWCFSLPKGTHIWLIDVRNLVELNTSLRIPETWFWAVIFNVACWGQTICTTVTWLRQTWRKSQKVTLNATPHSGPCDNWSPDTGLDTHRSHGDDCPPVGIEHSVECCRLLLLFKHEDQGGKHDCTHPQQKE